jgi:trk system potassium uptake protein TrkH
MGRTFKLDTLRKAIFIITFAISVILFSTFLILINQGNEFTFMQVLFEVTSAFGTVGLTTGITPNLSNFSRVIIIVTMLFGRVGPLSFVLSIATRVKKKLPQLPEEEVAVG